MIWYDTLTVYHDTFKVYHYITHTESWLEYWEKSWRLNGSNHWIAGNALDPLRSQLPLIADSYILYLVFLHLFKSYPLSTCYVCWVLFWASNILSENIKIPALKKEKTATTASTKTISDLMEFPFQWGKPERNICQMMLVDMNRGRGRGMKPGV